MTKGTFRLIERLKNHGFNEDHAWTLRKIQMTLHHWDEAECGDGNDYCSWAIERDEETGKPFKVVYPHKGGARRYPVPDRERGAIKRLEKIMAQYPSYTYYHQSDCRGCALYIIAKKNIKGNLDSCYTNGIAVCE